MAGVDALPAPEQPLTTSLVEALHFRRGFHYIAVREMEMEIPIPSLESEIYFNIHRIKAFFVGGEPDWSIVSRAWWDAVDLIEESEKDGVFAVDMALELRIMGGSDVLMAPQFGNKHGTLAIEPVSTRIVHRQIWEDFKEKLAKIWMNYRDYDGSRLLSRVHWAKESPRSVTIDGAPMGTIEHWHEIYRTNMELFFDILNNLSEGVSIEDINKTFSNPYLDQLFAPEWKRYGVKLPELKKVEGHSVNGNISVGDEVRERKSTCCVIS